MSPGTPKYIFLKFDHQKYFIYVQWDSIGILAIFLWYGNTILIIHVIVRKNNINDCNALMSVFLFYVPKYS